jgi:hypothetical protein
LSTGIDSVMLLGNVTFNNSALHGGHLSANILLGGVPQFGAVTRSVVAGNLAYFAPAVPASNVKIGYDTTRNTSVRVAGNVVAGGLVVLDMHEWDSAVVSGDTLIGDPGDTSRVVALTASALQRFQWAENRYYQVGATSPRWRFRGTSYPLAQWRSLTGFAADSLEPGEPPARITTWKSPDGGRAFVSVFNSAAGSARIDLPQGALMPGDSFTVRDVQRLSAPLAAGRFNGSTIDIPLTAQAPQPARNWPTAGPGTGTRLHVYVIDRVR